jgi:CheY-like chemotaxis protein
MPGGGKLTIETGSVELDASYSSEQLGVTPGPHAMLAVTDTGTGMSRETRARIFEPFFTTKEKGKGTGLGLSTVFGIVQQSGGHVWVYSEPGEGTTFKVYLPEAASDGLSSTPPSVPVVVHGKETILLAEDEEQVRRVARDVLERYGYRVLEAGNAGEALLICESHPGTIDLVLTDVIMPQMTGPQLAERLARVRPDVPVLFMSGYTENAIVRHGILESGLSYLPKPFTPETLARRVRQVLDARRPHSAEA